MIWCRNSYKEGDSWEAIAFHLHRISALAWEREVGIKNT